MSDAKSVITQAANRVGVDPRVLYGVFGQESSYGKGAPDNPFQLEPGTAASLGVKNRGNFTEAANGAARYLAQYKSRGLAGMLSAYNAGPAGGARPEYVKKVLERAGAYGGPSVTIPGTPPQAGAPVSRGTSARTEQVETANPRAKGFEALKSLLKSERGSSENPLLSSGVLAKAAEPTLSTKTIPGIPGVPTGGTPAPAPAAGGGGKLGGFLGAQAPLEIKRTDEGQDIQTRPGEALLAPGDGEVIAVKTDPAGFGPDYPVVKITSGPLAGTSWYLGHTDTTLKQGQSFKAGQPIARTSKTGHNAPPGWLELGEASTIGQGNRNQGAGVLKRLGGR